MKPATERPMSYSLYLAIRDSCYGAILVSVVAGPLSAASAAEQPQLGTSRTDIPFVLVTPQTSLVMAAHPRRILTAPKLQYLPIEVLSALAKREWGVDPLDCEWVLVVAELRPTVNRNSDSSADSLIPSISASSRPS